MNVVLKFSAGLVSQRFKESRRETKGIERRESKVGAETPMLDARCCPFYQAQKTRIENRCCNQTGTAQYPVSSPDLDINAQYQERDKPELRVCIRNSAT
jgi:hypothetical protein